MKVDGMIQLSGATLLNSIRWLAVTEPASVRMPRSGMAVCLSGLLDCK